MINYMNKEYNYTEYQKTDILNEKSTNIGFYFFLFLQSAAYFLGFRVYQTFMNTSIILCLPDDLKEDDPKNHKIKYEDKYTNEYNKISPDILSQEDLVRLKNCFIMERTPLGNLMMYYDDKRESFVYYSDNTIPYRFLEVASRHYVIQNNCKAIHVNMQDELSEAEKKVIINKEKKKDEQVEVKKSVFAKLKNYNTSSIRAPNEMKQNSNRQMSNSNRQMSNSKQNTDGDANVVVKDKANRYSYEGKFSNFSFLKKVEKKLVDKRYQMTFAEFKKIGNLQN